MNQKEEGRLAVDGTSAKEKPRDRNSISSHPTQAVSADSYRQKLPVRAEAARIDLRQAAAGSVQE